MSEIIIDKNAKQITFKNNGIAFSQFGIANEILDLIENQEKEIERLNNIINEIKKENQELKEKTKLFHKNGVFSLEYDKETLRDMVLEYQEEIERLNNAFDCLEQVIRYYVIDNVKYDNNTAEYILNRMLTFWRKDSDKE